ncbi:hypothetical protein [Halalkalibacter krulwichiae]|uniref:Uncharacterized protein n=1 Tax=Halalkalibacter krulwichiae TaxID=199441 RepID=A0A1X9MD32_9BACI|nr:hypothetical protein [Halalkalibacter krulwichiae]ARK31328.1 hypothetical protein BkAM31D_16530 [Halalkalibacter krulwichiae]
MKNIALKIFAALFVIFLLLFGIGSYVWTFNSLTWGIPIAIFGFMFSCLSLIVFVLFWVDSKRQIIHTFQ